MDILGVAEHTSFGSQTQQGGRRDKSQPAGTSQRYDPAHCHPGQARTVYPKSQLGGYVCGGQGAFALSAVVAQALIAPVTG